MDSQLHIDPTKLITLKNDRPLTTSLKIAEVFGKEHKHVMRDIRSLIVSEKFNRSNFGLIEYSDSRGRAMPAYEMTKNGAMFLIMKYEGPKASAIKEAYIEAFDMMAEALAARFEYRDTEAAFGMGMLTDREVVLGFGKGEAVAQYCENGHLWMDDLQIDHLLGYKMPRTTQQLFYRHQRSFPVDSYEIETHENGVSLVLFTPRAWAVIAKYSQSGYALKLALAAVEHYVAPGNMEVNRHDYLSLAECAHEARDKMRGLADGSRDLWLEMQDARDSAEDAYLRLERDQRDD
tara:strand:- start:10484 stop:11356 length:873 start_codon:yes stop_codon:yes gene_type:complete